MRKKDDSTDIYIEVESRYFGDWNNLGTLIETLAAIDIHPQRAVEQNSKDKSGKVIMALYTVKARITGGAADGCLF